MRTPTPVCSVIIPVFNKWELTRNCLASLREHTAEHDIEVVVVDNGSSDATVSDVLPYGNHLFGKRFSAIVFPDNKNFGPACNAGAAAAAADIIFFLNNDTIMTPGWFPPLLEAVSGEAKPGAIGPLLLYEDGSVQHVGVTYGTRGPFHLYQHFPPDHPAVSRKRPLQSITGAALMIRAGFFRECGGFYEEYRNGFEDLDLCVQIRRRGGSVRCVPTSRIYHLESQTPGRNDGDDHNALVFSRRCAAHVYTDIHRHAVRDGFSFFVSDLLTIAVKLTDHDEHALSAEATGKDAALWLRLVDANPLWVHGRVVLAHSLEQAGRYVEATRFRTELAEIEPTLARYKELLTLAPLAGNPPWREAAQRRLDFMARMRTNREAALREVHSIRQHFCREGEPVLDKMFAAKLREWHP